MLFPSWKQEQLESTCGPSLRQLEYWRKRAEMLATSERGWNLELSYDQLDGIYASWVLRFPNLSKFFQFSKLKGVDMSRAARKR
jgi:hypothetical protein